MRETDKSSEQMGGEYAESIMEPREAEKIIAKRFERGGYANMAWRGMHRNMREVVKPVMAKVLGAALVLSMLSGCGGKVNVEESSAEGSSTESSIVASDATERNADGTEESSSMDAKQKDVVTELLSQMTLEEKVGQMMVASFRVWQDLSGTASDAGKTVESQESAAVPERVNVTELNDTIRECIQKNHIGGTILFAENFKNAEQTLRLVMDLQTSSIKGGGVPLFVAVDQEGGSVARIGFGTTGVGNMALAATADSDNAKAMAKIYGTELQALGINMDYAPVLDVNNNARNPVIGVRSFSDSPRIVQGFGDAFMEGLRSTGTIATLKHFPGHGDTNTDSHTGFPCIYKTYEELKSFELVPYEGAIENGADMIMTAHIQYPEIEKETYVSISTGEDVYLPATMSHVILTDILRGDLGFEGVVVTDALEMGAIADNFATEDILCKSINAGADMLMLPMVYDSVGLDQVNEWVDLTIKLVKEGKIDEARIEESVCRILALKEKYGILEETDFSVTQEKIDKALETVGCKEHRDQAWEIAVKALTLVKNDNQAFPLKWNEGDETLILFADSCASRVGYGELAKQMLGDDKIVVMANTKDNGEECLKAAKKATHVILVNRVYSEACMDPNTGDGFSTAVFDEIIKARHADGKQVIVISSQLPYDAARFTEADAILLAYCSSVMRTILPESGEGSAYSPNLAAAIVSCFGDEEVKGNLPVSLPALDENYKLTDQILFAK